MQERIQAIIRSVNSHEAFTTVAAVELFSKGSPPATGERELSVNCLCSPFNSLTRYPRHGAESANAVIARRFLFACVRQRATKRERRDEFRAGRARWGVAAITATCVINVIASRETAAGDVEASQPAGWPAVQPAITVNDSPRNSF